jgi:hypothetical protein
MRADVRIPGRPDGGADVDAAIDPSSACGELAIAHCDRLDECSHGIGVARRFGTRALCLARAALWCRQALSIEHGLAVEVDMRACASALPVADCHDVVYGRVDACRLRGELPPREPETPCVFDGQCASGSCESVCGTCQPEPPSPARQDEGGMCNFGYVCRDDLYCIGITGKGSPGMCVRLETEVGAPCDPFAIELAPCDDHRGLVCNADTRRCEVIPILEHGAECPTTAHAYGLRQAVCRGGDSCGAGVCAPTPREGEPCSGFDYYPRADDLCVWPARCDVGADGSGVCMLPNAIACGG